MNLQNLNKKDWIFTKYTVDFPSIDKYDIKADSPKQIDGIVGTDIVVIIDKDSVVSPKILVSNKNVEPLDLTVEMLEKNGFDKYIDGTLTTLFRQKDSNESQVEEYNINIYKEDCNDYFTIEIRNELEFAYMSKRIRYVHELQHAMRECNLEHVIEELNVN